MAVKHPEVSVMDKAITVAYNRVGFKEFCEIIGEPEYWTNSEGIRGMQNQYALEKFQIFQEAIVNISRLGDFWEKIMDWSVDQE